MGRHTERSTARLALLLPLLALTECGDDRAGTPIPPVAHRRVGSLDPARRLAEPLTTRTGSFHGKPALRAVVDDVRPRRPREAETDEATVTWEEALDAPSTPRVLLRRDHPLHEPVPSDRSFEGPRRNGWTGPLWRDPFCDAWRRPRREVHATARSQAAVEHALRWLAAHQAPDGRWEAETFMRWCDGRRADRQVDRALDGPGSARHDVGVTGLALCAFRGAGYTSRGRHPYARVVWRALRYLRSVQDDEGCFGPRLGRAWIYDHAVGALAMVEAYGVTSSPVFKASAQEALDFIAHARTPGAGWRYGVRGGGSDTSVTAWMVAVLHSAEQVDRAAVARGRRPPLEIDGQAFSGARAWIDRMTDPDLGRTGYVVQGGPPARYAQGANRHPPDLSESTTACALFVRFALGENPRTSEIGKKGARLCALHPPRWDPEGGTIDASYWYWGTLALLRVGGRDGRVWNTALTEALCASQRLDGSYCDLKGSWDPLGPWGAEGGRVFATAMLAMCLETPYRYD